MEFSVHELAALLGAEVVGTTQTRISGLAKIEEGRPGTISFLANPKYLPHLYTTQATAVLVPSDFSPEKPVSSVLLKVKDPYTAFTLLLEKAQSILTDKRGIENPCFTAPDAEIGENVYIGAFSYIGKKARIGKGAKIYPFAYVGDHAVIGEGSVLYPNSTVYYGCRVGSHCILHAGAVIGSDGFGFAPQPDGSLKKIPQTGIVVLEDHVEIGANTTIDRATLGETVIRKGVKLDNLVQVAHNVEIGGNTVIAAQAGISGSTKLGANCMVGGQVGIVGHIKLADGTQIGAQSGVSKSVEKPRSALRGSPAQEYRKQLRSEVLFQQLEEMEKRIRSLEAQLKDKQ
jgi:UDP-3-O-[3-hydroxymyristoyl] glucosamine N-acyltransferase